MAVRKGYVHALEGVIAALIVVFYLTSIVSVPDPTSWTRSRLAKTSEDVMSVADRTGVLDDAVARGDAASFNAFVTELDSSLTYDITVHDIPRSMVQVAVLATNGTTYTSGSSTGGCDAPGLPVTYSPYRCGSITDGPFGGLDFVLSDTRDDNETVYSTVNLDVDADGTYGDIGEGPFRTAERFACDGTVTGCQGERYTVGPFNDTLRLYAANVTHDIASVLPNTSVGRRDVSIDYTTVNPWFQSLDPYDAVYTRGLSLSTLRDQDDVLDPFLADEKFLLVQSAVPKSNIDGSYLGDLGFSHLTKYEVQGGGTTTNDLFTVHGSGNRSYRTSTYYLDGALRVHNTTDQGGYDTATLTIRGQDIDMRIYDGNVSLSTESYAANHTVGDTVVLSGNEYRVDGFDPLALSPEDQQRFDSFDTSRIEADYHVTKMVDRRYNISAYDTSGEASEETSNNDDPRLDGIVESNCNVTDYPYRFGEVTMQDGSTYEFLQFNFETQAFTGGDCNAYYEYVYFDFPTDASPGGDGDFNDDANTTSDGFSGEGPYQRGDTVQIDVENYTVRPHNDGNGTDLTRVGPRLVGEIPVTRGANEGRGSAALLRRETLGDDDASLLGALLARETQSAQQFTAPRSSGDVSLGYDYVSMFGGANKLGYRVETTWWFQ